MMMIMMMMIMSLLLMLTKTRNYRVFQKQPFKTFWNIFTSVKFFCVKFCQFVGNSYPHVPANLCTFSLILNQMALIFSWVPFVFTASSFEYWMQTLREQGLGEKAIISSDTMTGWKLSIDKKVCSRVDHTGSAVLRKPGTGTGRPTTASACSLSL